MSDRIIPPQCQPRDLAGFKNNRWTIIKYVKISDCGSAMWLCECECGTIKEVAGTTIVTGKSKSCGCLAAERTSVRNSTHRLTKTPEHSIWRGLRSRVYNINSTGYSSYGGRGITVCPEWDDFMVFLSDMGHRPTPKHSIERRDNMSGYSPDNCYWATAKEQSRNRRSNHLITLNGKTLCLTDWAEITGIPYKTIHARIKRHNWSTHDALTRPVRK